MNRTKLVYIMNEEGLSDLEREAVLEGVEGVLKTAGVENQIKIEDLGAWKHKDCQNKNGSLIPHRSVEWYLQAGKEKSHKKTQLIVNELLNYVSSCDILQGNRILVLQSNIYFPNGNSTVGLSNHWGPAVVLSTYKFKGLDEETKYGCIKTSTMHELGHNFGLVDKKTQGVDYTHCANKCVMRPGKPSPDEIIVMTNDRLKYGPFCEPCEKQLKEYFKEKPTRTWSEPKILKYKKRN